MNQFLRTFSVVAVLCTTVPVFAQVENDTPRAKSKATIVSIGSVGPGDDYQSDADIVRYKEHFYVAFAKRNEERGSEFHILRSTDGRDWKPVASLHSEAEDRRPDLTYSAHFSSRPVWFSTMPSGRLCVTGRGKKAIVWSSEDGSDWREELDVNLSSSYSRIHWRNNVAYCASDETSSCGEKYEYFRLESAGNGAAPQEAYKLAHNSHTLSGPREAQLAFTKDRAICLLTFEKYNFDKVRRWLIPSRSFVAGRVGVSKAPYKEWTWKQTNLPFSQPNLLVMQDGRIISTVFVDGDDKHSALCQVDLSTGKLTELLRLPTGEAKQPVGLTEYDGHVWACFRDGPSSRENPPTLKVAKIKLGE